MKLRKYLLLGLSWLLLSVPLQAQIKPTAMLLPIYFVNLDKKGLQGSLNNHVQSDLSDYYELKSEKEIEQARDVSIDKLSSENCTEEACVKIMGELLDVDYTFSIEVIDTGEGWDLTVVRKDLVGETTRSNELCNKCSLSKARKELSKMLTALRPGEMIIQRGKASLRLISTPKSLVYLDGNEQGKTPLELGVDARKPLDITLIAEGYKSFSEEFLLEPGEKRTKSVQLSRKRGNIRIVSVPSGAKIFIDGKPKTGVDDITLQTPADLRLAYGKHVLKLFLDKYEDSTQTLNINRQDVGTKKITLKPKPGRLVVRVPSENKNANFYINGKLVGSMGGSLSKTFEVPANQLLRVEVTDQLAFSGKKSVTVDPDGSESVSFDWLQTQDSDGFRFGLGYEHDFFSLTLGGAGGTKILSDYSVSGISAHWILSPGRHLLSFKLLNGSGTFTEPSTPFYLVSGTQLYTVTETTATVFRALYSPGWEPGWNYALGWESIYFNFEAVQGTQTHVISSFLTEGGYDFSSFSDWMMQNSLSMETRLRYSFLNGIGYTFGVSWTF
jgi:hypothetical protein